MTHITVLSVLIYNSQEAEIQLDNFSGMIMLTVHYDRGRRRVKNPAKRTSRLSG